MKRNFWRLISVAACLTFGTSAAIAFESLATAEPAATEADAQATSEVAAVNPSQTPSALDGKGLAADDPPVYVPPRRGAPKTRVGGGTRSAGQTLHLAVLAPEQTGLTRSASPTLYWWLSDDHPGPVEVVVMAENGVAPLVRFRAPAPVTAGIHAVDLSSAGLALQAGVTYRWSVAIIRDENARARDVVATATLEYVPDQLVPLDAGALAAAGFWYDVIALLNSDRDPQWQAALLDQVDLAEVAQWLRTARGA